MQVQVYVEDYVLCKSQKCFEAFLFDKNHTCLKHLDYAKAEEANWLILKGKNQDFVPRVIYWQCFPTANLFTKQFYSP